MRKVTAVAVIESPMPGVMSDLTPMIEASADIGHELAATHYARWNPIGPGSFGKRGSSGPPASRSTRTRC
ncbi:MAG: hypothetical protein KIT18_00305 [Burkholderiales bacterium]|nr:hypothetical protein [Burkholderiales bacterium]